MIAGVEAAGGRFVTGVTYIDRIIRLDKRPHWHVDTELGWEGAEARRAGDWICWLPVPPAP